MFESKEEIAEAVEAVLSLFQSLDRGDTLPHEPIVNLLGLRPHEGQWDIIVNKARRRLEKERGVSTWPNHSGGYLLCTKAQQLNLASERLRRSARQVRKGRRSVQALPDAGLTDHQRRAKAFHEEHLLNAERNLREELKSVDSVTRPTPTIPRRQLSVSE